MEDMKAQIVVFDIVLCMHAHLERISRVSLLVFSTSF
jgi:hypothetical protein